MLPPVTEDFVQYVWQFSLFNKNNLRLNSGSRVQVVHPGTLNKADGPDFFSAKIYIDETLWVGNIEIHLNVDDWKAHNHTSDAGYNNVVLHVVYHPTEKSVQLENGRFVPTLVIGHRIFENTLKHYTVLMNEPKVFLPCEKVLNHTDTFIWQQYASALIMQRLERKIAEIESDMLYTQGDIDAAFLMSLFKYFGAPLNKEPFHLLSKSFTLSQLIKQNVSETQLEAMLFGLADLLHEQDSYAIKLQNEFQYLKTLYKWKLVCKESQWKFSMVRPSNFPTVRIAQLAALLHKQIRLFTSILQTESINDLYKLFAVLPSAYWQEHYSFGTKSKEQNKHLSKEFIDKILINVVVPFLFFYGKYINDESYIDRAMYILSELKPEKNGIILGFKKLNINCQNALESQAAIELYNELCSHKKCLDCRLAYTFF
ncbi:MAG: DUF2851 family protein, partial [Chitinophagales bacterium]|nr:DUF2851 family protein [Chitinophagales bacterium]